MNIDFTEHFQKYEQIVQLVDVTFEKILKTYPEEVKCKVGCSDCCHAIFDITFIEAIYINKYFNEKFKGEKRDKLLDAANKADRAVYKLKKEAYKKYQNGENEYEIFREIGNKRLRCPLLNQEDTCEIYEKRPLTCRIYGIPTSVGGRGHTCGISGFDPGVSYPTVNMDALYKKMFEISHELVASLNTKHKQMGDMLIPVSMAVLNEFDDEYLGIIK